MSISQIMEEMIAFSQGNVRDIEHFLKVWAYARTIGEQQNLDEETQRILEIAAITHDIACPLCRKKYGNAGRKLQEKEGGPLVRDFLSDSDLSDDKIERIAFLVAHHHTLSDIDGQDWQILIEADYIVNASENTYDPQNIREFMNNIMKTQAGKRLCANVFGLE